MLRSPVIRTALVFVLSYVIALACWIQVKDYYGYAVTFVSSKFVAGLKNARMTEIMEKGDTIEATFEPSGKTRGMLVDIPFKTSNYTFNVPLTIAIMAAFWPHLARRGRAYAEACLLLLTVHLLYVFSYGAQQMTAVLIDRGMEQASVPKEFFYEFLWTFTDNMIIRFEPFLIGSYLFFRFRRR